MRFGSVCSGIEAASVAWHPLGWKAAWLSEIEPFPSAVLAHHYPNVPNLGDMTALPQRIASGEVEAPDVFCGGTPCQAFSVAGLRRSLDDDRGNLSLTFCEIANEIDRRRLDAGHVPAIIFWENVPGVLNTKDNAFGCFLGAIAGEDAPLEPAGKRWTNAGCVHGPQRTVAWRVLDAQYFGVAQRRRRVFVVASARDDFDPAAVLFESDGLRRDTAPRREAGERIAPCVTNGPPFSRTGNERVEAEAMVVVAQPHKVGNTLTARMHKGMNSTLDEGQTPVIALQDVTPREKAQNGKGWNDDGTAYTVDTHATQGVAQPAYAIQGSMIGRNDQAGPQGGGINEEVCFTQNTADRHAVAQPIAFDAYNQTQSNTTAALRCAAGGVYDNTVVQPMPINTMVALRHEALGERTGFGIGEAGDPAYTLTKGHSHAVAQSVGVDIFNAAITGDVAAPLTHRSDGTGTGPTLLAAMQVRRLTPMECERLQGFPDGYTNIPWRKKPESPDGPRYKSLGNSWAVPVVRWIGKRIQNQLGDQHV